MDFSLRKEVEEKKESCPRVFNNYPVTYTSSLPSQSLVEGNGKSIITREIINLNSALDDSIVSRHTE